jgi:hypothetical protein
MLDEKNSHLYETYKKAYSEILHRWNLLDARAQVWDVTSLQILCMKLNVLIIISIKWHLILQVLKYMSTPAEVHRGVEFYSECQYCNNKVRGAGCLLCKRLVMQCSICNLSVRGRTMCPYSVTVLFIF